MYHSSGPLAWESFCKEEIIEKKEFIEIIENASFPTYSPDWKSFAYVARKDWKGFIVKDWLERDKKYDDIDSPTYSPDWKSFAYKAKRNWKSFIVKDWVEWDEYDDVGFPIYSPDWKSLTYEAKRNWQRLIVKQTCGKRENTINQIPTTSSDIKEKVLDVIKNQE